MRWYASAPLRRPRYWRGCCASDDDPACPTRWTASASLGRPRRAEAPAAAEAAPMRYPAAGPPQRRGDALADAVDDEHLRRRRHTSPSLANIQLMRLATIRCRHRGYATGSLSDHTLPMSGTNCNRTGCMQHATNSRRVALHAVRWRPGRANPRRNIRRGRLRRTAGVSGNHRRDYSVCKRAACSTMARSQVGSYCIPR